MKWYLKREGKLDMVTDAHPDYYLVLTGPQASVATKSTRPWGINAVYLFDTVSLLADMADRGRRVGVASSVRNASWTRAEVFPAGSPALFAVTEEKRAALRQFAID